jgi:hypothetical protein
VMALAAVLVAAIHFRYRGAAVRTQP